MLRFTTMVWLPVVIGACSCFLVLEREGFREEGADKPEDRDGGGPLDAAAGADAARDSSVVDAAVVTDASPVDAPPQPGDSGNQGEKRYCKGITITPGAVLPSGYSIEVRFDHAQLVRQGKSAPDGHDVRILRQAGGPLEDLDRVLGFESQWNTDLVTVWFATQAELPAGPNSGEYFLCYGDLESGAPPADPERVFVFFEDFESGVLDRWSVYGQNVWSVAPGEGRSGSSSLKVAPVPGDRRYIVAKGIDEADVVMDAYWKMSTVAGMDLAQGVRAADSSTAAQYETNLDEPRVGRVPRLGYLQVRQRDLVTGAGSSVRPVAAGSSLDQSDAPDARPVLGRAARW